MLFNVRQISFCFVKSVVQFVFITIDKFAAIKNKKRFEDYVNCMSGQTSCNFFVSEAGHK